MTPCVQLLHFLLTVFTFFPGKCWTEYACSNYAPHMEMLKYARKTHCFRNDIDTNGLISEKSLQCKDNPTGIGWTVQDIDNGDVDVSFTLLHNVKQYTLTLEIFNKTEEECSATSDVETGFVHSIRDYDVYDSNNDDVHPVPGLFCLKEGIVSFKYVFSGCYRLKIKHQNSESLACPRYIHTKYKRTDILESPQFHYDYYCTLNHVRTLRLTLKFDYSIGPHELSIKINYNINLQHGGNRTDTTDACQETGKERACCSFLPNERDIICRDKNNTAKCHQDENQNIICEIPNVPPGNHCAIVDYTVEDRCQPQTIWTNGNSGCIGVGVLNLTETLCPVNSNEVPTSPNIILPVVLCILIVALLCCLAWYIKTVFCTKVPGSPGQVLEISSDEENNPLEVWEQPKVLLLYARDCIFFMKLMASFRNYLKSSGFQVYDCFQEECFEKVSIDPAQWVRNLVTTSHIKVIVISTECGRLRQLAQMQCRKVRYVEPHCFDDVFLYALKAIIDYKGADMYKRHHLLRLDQFTDDEHILTHITPHRIYTLPANLNDLLHNLRGHSSIKLKEEINGYLYEDKSKLREDLTNLINFKKQNPFYIKQFIEIC